MTEGWISLSAQKSTDVAPLENKKTISDLDMGRVATWAAATYLPNGVPNGDGTFREATAADIFAALTDGIYSEIKDRAEQWYIAKAMSDARASVQPITLTPTV